MTISNQHYVTQGKRPKDANRCSGPIFGLYAADGLLPKISYATSSFLMYI